MNTFIEYIKQFGDLSCEQISLLEELLFVKELKRNDYFLEAGQYSNEIAFIDQGVFRVYFYDKKGNEIVRYFLKENQFMVDLYSFENNVIGSEYIQSLTESRLIIISKDSFNKLMQLIPNWSKIIAKITQNALLEKLNSKSDLVNQDATTKYLDFINKNPNLANRIPLGQLASYLGIKQQSLSRIRHKIATDNSF